MKQFLTGILLGWVCMTGIWAQSSVDLADYQAGISKIATARISEDYLEAARFFEQLATRYPGQWIVHYYAGLSYIHASRQAHDDQTRDALLDRVQPLIDKAFKLHPGEPEIHVLQAFLYQSRIQVNPELRGLTYSQKADASLKKAVAQDPDNPRAYLLKGYNVYFTPALFGGGAKNALPHFLKARDKYLHFRPSLPYYPDWGEAETHQMIKTCSQAKNQPQ
jgi:tetratricopeptide (TPR) repeat protein